MKDVSLSPKIHKIHKAYITRWKQPANNHIIIQSKNLIKNVVCRLDLTYTWKQLLHKTGILLHGFGKRSRMYRRIDLNFFVPKIFRKI